jgi:hypothetical protein
MSEVLIANLARQRAQDAAISYVVGDLTDEAAFAALCTAVTAYLDARRETASHPPARFPFGVRKGQALEAGSVLELQALERYLSDTMDAPDKKAFKRSNLALRAAVLAELHRRQRGRRHG